MSELDPVTFLIATELLAGSDATSSHRPTSMCYRPTVNSASLILLAEGRENDGDENELSSIESFEHLSLRAQRDFGTHSVRLAYLQSNSPSLSDVVEDLLSHRIHQVRILPMFLSDSSIAATDIALQIHALQEKYAALEIELLPAIGEDPRFQRLLWRMVCENALPEWLVKTS
jgi:sirohydrochlorin cobaltochelatase